MAKIGVTNFRYGLLTEATDGTPTYTGVKTPGKAISCNVEVTNNDAKLYGDDVLIESDTSFSGGNVTMGIDNDDITTMAELLGHTTATTGSGQSAVTSMVRNANDTAPYVRIW